MDLGWSPGAKEPLAQGVSTKPHGSSWVRRDLKICDAREEPESHTMPRGQELLPPLKV